MNRAVCAKYLSFVRIAAARTWRAPGELYGRVAFFAVILGVFTSLWNAVAEAGMPIAAEPRTLVWYLAITEWIVLSAPPVHMEIQETIRRGDIVCRLGRPVSYVGAEFAEGVGTLLVRAPVLFATACVCAFAFTRWTPPITVLATVAVFGLGAAALLTALCLGVGLLSFWLGDVAPVWWVFQKALFILGGLMMPLTLYPRVVQAVAPYTPFPAALSGPASLVLQPSTTNVWALALTLAAWACLTGLGLWLLFRRAVVTMTVNGG